MKNLTFVILLIVGIVLGVLVQKYILAPEGDMNLVAEPTPIESVAEVQELVNNYMESGATEKYYYLTDEVVDQLAYVKSQVNNGDGFVVRFGSSSPGAEYDAVIYSRFQNGLQEIETYFQAPMDAGRTDMCPHMCDIDSPISYP